MSLKKGYLKQQFSLFCWVHMTLLLIVVSRYAPKSVDVVSLSEAVFQPLHYE